MKRSQYLYGYNFDTNILVEKKWIDGWKYQIECAESVLSELFKKPYAENGRRIMDICDAIIFCEKKIEEIKDKELYGED